LIGTVSGERDGSHELPATGGSAQPGPPLRQHSVGDLARWQGGLSKTAAVAHRADTPAALPRVWVSDARVACRQAVANPAHGLSVELALPAPHRRASGGMRPAARDARALSLRFPNPTRPHAGRDRPGHRRSYSATGEAPPLASSKRLFAVKGRNFKRRLRGSRLSRGMETCPSTDNSPWDGSKPSDPALSRGREAPPPLTHSAGPRLRALLSRHNHANRQSRDRRKAAPVARFQGIRQMPRSGNFGLQ